MATEYGKTDPLHGVQTGEHAHSQNGSGTTEQVQDQVRERTREMKDRVMERSDELKERAETKAAGWTEEAGERVERVSRALRRAGEALEDEGEGRLSALTSSVAEQVERLGGYLRDENPTEMVRDLERMAKGHPGVFIGSTLVTGLLIGRFLRASAPEGDNLPTAPLPMQTELHTPTPPSPVRPFDPFQEEE